MFSQVFEVENKPWNTQLSKASTLKMRFNGYMRSPGEAAPSEISVEFRRKSEGPGSGSGYLFYIDRKTFHWCNKWASRILYCAFVIGDLVFFLLCTAAIANYIWIERVVDWFGMRLGSEGINKTYSLYISIISTKVHTRVNRFGQ